jgi:hypothetical protein
MSPVTLRRPRSLAKHLLFALTVVLAAATLAVVASGGNSKSYADGANSPPECIEADNDNVIGSVSPTDAAAGVTVPAGNVVLGVCIKAGEPHSGPLGNGTFGPGPAFAPDGCFEVSGVGTQTVTVEDIGDCPAAGLSHIDVIFGPPPPNGTTPPNGTAPPNGTVPPPEVKQPPAPKVTPQAPAPVVAAARFTG